MTRPGAWRSRPIRSLRRSGHGAATAVRYRRCSARERRRYGGYYTKAAIREIVALAGRLGIEVVPEIDVPGHCYAMLQALPRLRDPDETGTLLFRAGLSQQLPEPGTRRNLRRSRSDLRRADRSLSLQDHPHRSRRGAARRVVGFAAGSRDAARDSGAAAAHAHGKRRDVLTNAHGADEIGGSGAAVLQAEFLRRVHALLAARGCTTGGWQEAAHGNVIDKAKCYLNGWRTVEISAALAGEGYDIVVCPGQVYYLDMANGPAWSEPGAAGPAGPIRRSFIASIRSRAGRSRRNAISSACRPASGRSP